MTDINALFKNRKVKLARLLPFGFSERGDGYAYSTGLLGGRLEMSVTVNEQGKIAAEVIDAASGERYALHRVSGARGAFVGAVREEYERVLKSIREACCEPDVFKSEGARRIIAYVRKKYQDDLQFLWQRFPDNAVFRRQDNAKWYAALLIVPKIKLGLAEAGTVEIIDLRGKPENIAALEDGSKYFPGYHMNKKHWFTIRLDGSVSMEEIFDHIDESFALAGK